MRIRTIKPEFFVHEALFELENETGLPVRLAFIGLWCAADREGRFKWEPRRLGVQILPYDQTDFSRVLHALTTRGFVVRYASETGEFGYIPSFTRHQVINNREKDSELPNPLECKQSDASSTREARDDHAGKAEGKGREQGKEGNKESRRSAPGLAEAVYAEYPRKIGKPKALKAIEKALRAPPEGIGLDTWPGMLVEITARYAQTRKGEDETYTPHPSTWFNEARYNDDPATWKSRQPHAKSHQPANPGQKFAVFRDTPEGQKTSHLSGKLF